MKFMHKVKLPEAYARTEWCRMNLGKQVRGGNWWRHRGYLYFKDEQSYIMYMLRWA